MSITRDNAIWIRASETSKGLRESEEQVSNYASGLWEYFVCPRRAYYRRLSPSMGGDEWFDAAEHGNWIHDMIVDRFKKAGMWRGDEVRGGNAQFNITYRLDLLIDDGNGVHPVEIKSVKEDKNPNYNRWLKAVKEPFFAHILQLQCYLHFHKPSPYEYGYLMYFNRNTEQVCIYKVDHDEQLGKEIEAGLFALEWAIQHRAMPSKLSIEDDCYGCPHKVKCKEEFEKEASVPLSPEGE